MNSIDSSYIWNVLNLTIEWFAHMEKKQMKKYRYETSAWIINVPVNLLCSSLRSIWCSSYGIYHRRQFGLSFLSPFFILSMFVVFSYSINDSNWMHRFDDRFEIKKKKNSNHKLGQGFFFPLNAIYIYFGRKIYCYFCHIDNSYFVGGMR